MSRLLSFSWIIILLFVTHLVHADSILGGLVNDEDDFLSPDQAFQLSVSLKDARTIQTAFTVAPGHYLYKSRMSLTSSDATLSPLSLPSGEMKEDPNFGTQEVYHHDFLATADLEPADKTQEKVTIQVKYQGCSEKGLCYAPIRKTFTLDLLTNDTSNPSQAASLKVDQDSNLLRDLSSTAETQALLNTGSFFWIVVGFFGAGLLLSLTPCVLPMIPILSSIIVGHQQSSARQHSSFGLSVAYVVGMALSYTLAGVAAGLSGSLISQSLQNPWVLGATAGIFVLLSLSMFGLYDLKLPDRFESQMRHMSQNMKGGEYIGVFVMGVLSALIVSPCVAAPLAGALLYIGQTHNVLLGGVSLFALSIGMGVPLLLIGASAGKVIPKAGSWMNVVKHAFGLVMLGMAVWIVAPLISESLVLTLSAVLVCTTAMYAWQIGKSFETTGARVVGTSLAYLGVIYAAALLIGALSGGQSVTQPLTHLQLSQNQSADQVQSLKFDRISNLEELDQRILAAGGRPVMLDFYADWCVACKEMEHETFSDPAVKAAIKDTILLQADVTKNTAEDQALLKRFGLYGPPGILFFDRQGQLINGLTTVGFKKPAEFSQILVKRDRCTQHQTKC